MAELHPEDFRDSIDDMCDDAIRRMRAFQEGGLATMHSRDYYKSIIEDRDRTLGMVAYDTVTRAEIVDQIHPELMKEPAPEYLIELLAGGVVVLSRHASYWGRNRNALAASIDSAKSHVAGRFMLRDSEMNKPIRLYSQDLGSIGMTTLVLNHENDVWHLDYEASHKVSRIRYA